MRIGILIRDFKTLDNWELRVLDKIKNTPSLELVLLIKDGRKERDENNSKGLRKLLNSGNISGKILYKVQAFIESKVFKRKSLVNKEEIIVWLKTINSIELKPDRKGFWDMFNKQDSEIVRKYNLDIILRLGFNIVLGEILDAAKYGIWDFHHGNDSNRGPAGLCEIALKQPVVGITLQKLTSDPGRGLVIDKAFYNTHWSFYKTINEIKENSVSILFKNIAKLQQNKLTLGSSPVYFDLPNKNPSLKIVFPYIVSFYKTLISKISGALMSKLFGVRYYCWTISIGKGNYLESTLSRLELYKLPRNEFWADPFLFRHQSELYIFFENYDYKIKKGKISCGKIIGDEIKNVVDVLDFKTHLSYPFIVQEGTDIFMIPENSGSKRLEIYRCVEFPGTWELYSTAFEGELIVDTTYFIDDSGQRWLFLNKGLEKKYSELHIYKIDSLKLEHIESHTLNPVIIDSTTARNGGAIFRYNEAIYRPSQCNINGVYGYGLNLNVIKKLTLDDYVEEKKLTVEPNFKKGIVATHHLHQLENIFAIDACYQRK